MGIVKKEFVETGVRRGVCRSHQTLLCLWGLLLLFLAGCEGFENPLAAPTLTPLPPTLTPEPTLTPTPGPNTAVGFDNFLAQALEERVSDRQVLVNRFLAQIESGPITSGGRAIFIYQGAANTVQLVGDMNNWIEDQANSLTRLEGTDLWYLSVEFEPEARLDYQYLLNGTDSRQDPLNANSIRGIYGLSSELVMPDYRPPPELLPTAEEIPAGTLTTHTINSSNLNQTRTFIVYQPPGQLVGEKLPSVYMNDGSDFLNLVDAPAILDRLIAARQIPPVIAVFVPPIIRNDDYNRNEAYAAFLAEELVPFVQANFEADPAADKTAVLGASRGGLAAVHTAVLHPEVFGLVAGLSGAYATDDGALLLRVAGQGAPGVNFYLIVGTYETAVLGNPTEGNLLEVNRLLVDILEDKGYPYLYEEFPQGHSWGLWEATIGRGLGYLFDSG